MRHGDQDPGGGEREGDAEERGTQDHRTAKWHLPEALMSPEVK